MAKTCRSVNDSVPVIMGYNRSRVYFPLRHIYPETTTERPGFVSQDAARPVVKTPGERVVIIGNDVEGRLDYIGKLALVVHCYWPLPSDQGCLYLLPNGPSDQAPAYAYFPEGSI